MDTDKELNELIKQSLAGHEEKYIDGSWENFVNKQKLRKRKNVLRYSVGMAAGLLIGLVCLSLYNIISIDSSLIKKGVTARSELTIDVVKPKTSQISFSLPDKKGISVINKSSTRNISINYTKSIAPSSSGETENVSTKMTESPAPESIEKEPNIKSDTIKNAQKTKEPEYSLAKISDQRRKVRFGINISPGFNATSTSSAFNYSGGLNVDIALSSSIQLSTGVQIESQSIVNKNSANNSAIPSDLSTADFVNLDFPINLTWKFFSMRSSSYYVSCGISTLAYLSEKYKTTSYRQELREAVTFMGTQENKTYKLENVETTTSHSEPAFHSFDPAGRINLVFGVEQKLSPKLWLHIEPFLKIPVSGLATEKLRYTTSGITCKISF